MNLERVIAVRTGRTVYRDNERCIKLFDSDYSKAEVLNEALCQARVEETDLLIPKILEVKKYEDKWVIVSDYIAGKTLDRLMEENPDKADEYFDMFVKVQMDIHSRKAPLLNKLKDSMNSKIFKAGLDSATLYDVHTRLESMPSDMKLCHGGFDPSHSGLVGRGSGHTRCGRGSHIPSLLALRKHSGRG